VRVGADYGLADEVGKQIDRVAGTAPGYGEVLELC
jgi:hypothetical protein